jgi:hypothetical protein
MNWRMIRPMDHASRPGRSEAAEYYFRYIDLVPDDDICVTLETQLAHVLALLARVPLDRVDYRYADDKWTVREVLSHVNDTERLFAFRAFWFARGFDSALPSFDQGIAFAHARAADRSWSSHVEEFRAVRASTVLLFRGLPAHAWLRRGTASDMSFTVRALAYLCAGHVIHHETILRDRYLEP